MQVRCLPGMSGKWVTFHPRFDPQRTGWTTATRYPDELEEKHAGGKFDEARRKRDVAKKHSRKDIASYASDAWNIRTKPERDRRGFHEGEGRCGGRKNTLARKKVIRRCSASLGGRGEDGALACGKRKSRFEKMKFAVARILVSIFIRVHFSLRVRVCVRVHAFSTFPRGWIIFIARAPARARYFSLPINHAADSEDEFFSCHRTHVTFSMVGRLFFHHARECVMIIGTDDIPKRCARCRWDKMHVWKY